MTIKQLNNAIGQWFDVSFELMYREENGVIVEYRQAPLLMRIACWGGVFVLGMQFPITVALDYCSR